MESLALAALGLWQHHRSCWKHVTNSGMARKQRETGRVKVSLSPSNVCPYLPQLSSIGPSLLEGHCWGHF